jgi:hypothetical protein
MSGRDLDLDFDMQKAQLGIEAEAFLQGNLGRYLLERAEVEIDLRTAELVKADPEDSKVNRELRMHIQKAQLFKTWLKELVSAGRLAEDRIHTEDQPDY